MTAITKAENLQQYKPIFSLILNFVSSTNLVTKVKSMSLNFKQIA